MSRFINNSEEFLCVDIGHLVQFDKCFNIIHVTAFFFTE